MDLLGINNLAQVKRADRNWEGIREFFVMKINELQTMISTEPETSDKKLTQRADIKVLVNIEAVVPDSLLQRPPGTNRLQDEIYISPK